MRQFSNPSQKSEKFSSLSPKETKRFRRIFIVVFLLFMGGGLSFTFWILSLDQELQNRLAAKRFLPPVEYYTGTLRFESQSRWTPQEVVDLLLHRGYRAVQPTQGRGLSPGEFRLGPSSQECGESSQGETHPSSSSCLYLRAKESEDPSPLLRGSPLQKMRFTGEGQILVEPPSASEKISLMGTGTTSPELMSPKTASPTPVASTVDSKDSNNEAQTTIKDYNYVELEPELLAQYWEGQPLNQTYVDLGEVPTYCLNAVLAIEDSRFLDHGGVSLMGTLRAAMANLFRGHAAQGGSTITQQMIKNYLLTPEKTLRRKWIEFFMALLLETHFTKDQILETYLNIIYMGQNGPFQVRGFEAASQFYFSKKVNELELHECSLLAAILNSPGHLNPFTKPEKVFQRRQFVLKKMLDLDLITEGEFQEARSKGLGVLRQSSALSETAPYYIDSVNREVRKSLQLRENEPLPPGIKIFTGLLPQAQSEAQASLGQHLKKWDKKNPSQRLEGLVLVVRNEDGLALSAIGGRSFKVTQFNRLVEGHRQVGSIMKPIVYLTALLDENKKYTPLTILEDRPFTHKYGRNSSWSPENFDKEYQGSVPLYVGLKNSLNAATASLGLELGLEPILSVARRLGIQSPMILVPSLILGAFELYPYEVVNAYLTIARMGKVAPRLHYLRFYKRGEVGAEIVIPNLDSPSKEPLDPKAIAVLVGMMKQTAESGTAKAIRHSGFPHPTAGKTGTTSDYRDAWFAGFTKKYTSVVWVGYDDNQKSYLTGSTGALPIWLEAMKKITSRDLPQDFSWPSGVEKRYLPSQQTPQVVKQRPGSHLGSTEAEQQDVELIFDPEKD